MLFGISHCLFDCFLFVHARLKVLAKCFVPINNHVAGDTGVLAHCLSKHRLLRVGKSMSEVTEGLLVTYHGIFVSENHLALPAYKLMLDGRYYKSIWKIGGTFGIYFRFFLCAFC